MNENVTIKTPKRRRWIARLLVSALCILLAFSLLFVGVSASYPLSYTAQYNSSVTVDQAGTTTNCFYINESKSIFYTDSKSGFDLYSPSYTFVSFSSFIGFSSSYRYPLNCSFDYYDDVIYCLMNVIDSSGNAYICLFRLGISSQFYIVNYYRIEGVTSVISNLCSIAVSSSGIAGFCSSGGLNGDNMFRVRAFYFGSSGLVVSDPYLFPYDDFTRYSLDRSIYLEDCIVFPGIGVSYDLSSNQFVSLELDSTCTFYEMSGQYYFVNEFYTYLFDPNSLSCSVVGLGLPGIRASISGSVLNMYSRPENGKFNYTVYTVTDTSSPPESSDETTTEPPPESSEGSSADPSGETKIWGSILNADGSYTSTLLGTLDLSQATEVRVYIGSWTSKDSPFQSETPVPLTFYVYNSEASPPDIYTFDYHAAGYSLLGDSVSDFTFPDVIGQFFTLPYNGETDLYFPNVAPFGTVLVSTPFGDSFGGRVMLNLVSVDSYFRLDFIDEDTFAVVLFNTAGPGSRTNFDLDIRAYREGYRLEDGETSSSRWFYPSFGSSASYTAEYVTESGLYLIFVDSVDDTVYPWEDGTWSDVIGDANSRIEDISTNHALLESLANEAYGKYSFDPMTNQNFIGAVSEFNDIRESSGGNYILRYIWGMWNIHPFASSMIAIVGTLAIVGFIIRKM